MTIHINNKAVQAADGASLLDVLAAQGLDGSGVAVAVDNKVVPRADWAARVLADGARLTVIRAVCGG